MGQGLGHGSPLLFHMTHSGRLGNTGKACPFCGKRDDAETTSATHPTLIM